MKTITELVGTILREGYIGPSQETDLIFAIDSGFNISEKDFAALARLQKAVRSGRVTIEERRKCVNLMEEMVWTVISEEYATLKIESAHLPDMGDVAAYALNHLAPLYATTCEGAEFLRDNADDELWRKVRKRVREALENSLGRPVFHSGSTPQRKSP